jgi:hypothetical protein
VNFKYDLNSPIWWIWTVTLAALLVGLIGIRGGFVVAIAISIAQASWFSGALGFKALPAQVRIAYLAIAAIAYLDSTTLLYVLLALVTAVLVAFDRDLIAEGLAFAPWNAAGKAPLQKTAIEKALAEEATEHTPPAA